MSRAVLVPFVAAAFLVAPALLPIAPATAPGLSGAAQAATNLNTSRSNNYRATTVKSSKSNTSDRMGGGGGRGSARATTVKSSKSNSSDRMGGGGGRGGGATFGPGIGIGW